MSQEHILGPNLFVLITYEKGIYRCFIQIRLFLVCDPQCIPRRQKKIMFIGEAIEIYWILFKLVDLAIDHIRGPRKRRKLT
jgi:hypothetical protein